MPELGPYGSVRGARGNSRPYREIARRWILIIPRRGDTRSLWRCPRLRPRAASMIAPCDGSRPCFTGMNPRHLLAHHRLRLMLQSRHSDGCPAIEVGRCPADASRAIGSRCHVRSRRSASGARPGATLQASRGTRAPMLKAHRHMVGSFAAFLQAAASESLLGAFMLAKRHALGQLTRAGFDV